MNKYCDRPGCVQRVSGIMDYCSSACSTLRDQPLPAPVQVDWAADHEERRKRRREKSLGGVPGTIPWDVHLRAWEGYAAAGHGDQSAKRIAERGGFSYCEVQCALLGHYNECGPYHRDEHPPVPGWEPA